MVEIWLKYPCPMCKHDNWYYCEQWDEINVEAITCWYCDETCWIELYEEDYDIDQELQNRHNFGIADRKEHIVAKGFPRPRNKKFNKFSN